MQVEVLLFGAERAAAGRDKAVIAFSSTSPIAPTCRTIRDRLGEHIPALRPHLTSARFAVNGEFVSLDQTISASDEVALIGLVSGG